MASALEALTECPPEELTIDPADPPYLLAPRVSEPPRIYSEPTGRLNHEISPFDRLIYAIPTAAERREVRDAARKRKVERDRRSKLAQAGREQWRQKQIVNQNIELTLRTGRRLDGAHYSTSTWNRGCRCDDCLVGALKLVGREHDLDAYVAAISRGLSSTGYSSS